MEYVITCQQFHRGILSKYFSFLFEFYTEHEHEHERKHEIFQIISRLKLKHIQRSFDLLPIKASLFQQ
jgi:hypothetical protein